MENPIRIDDVGVPPIVGNLYTSPTSYKSYFIRVIAVGWAMFLNKKEDGIDTKVQIETDMIDMMAHGW